MSQAMKWVHKEKVEPLEAENERLKSENAKLRECLKARELKVVLQESDLDEIVRIACDMYFVISTLEVANDEAVVSKDGVMLDMEHFSKELRELGVEVD